MKLAISNIACTEDDPDEFYRLLKKEGCDGVELALGKIWKDPTAVSAKERKDYRKYIESFGLEIPAIHALLFGFTDLKLFGSARSRQKTVDFLRLICESAKDLGAKVLVFGSPQARVKGLLSFEEAFKLAVDFFGQIAPAAKACKVDLCIEPLRPNETDFIHTVDEGIRLVKAVDREGFHLHVDATAFSDEGGDLTAKFQAIYPEVKHFHVNDPDLAEVNSTGKVDHQELASVLRSVGYDKYVSIEMRGEKGNTDMIRRSLRFVKQTYIEGKK